MRGVLSFAEENVASEVFLVLFCLIVVGLITWVYLPSRKARYESEAQMPLQDD